MRRLRKLIQAAIPVLGALVIFLALIVISDAHAQTRLGIVLVGILMIEAGVWGLTNSFLPSERQYLGLRGEVDAFIFMVRELNRAAVEARATDDGESWARYREMLVYMHDSVDRMGELAGRAEEGDPLLANTQPEEA